MPGFLQLIVVAVLSIAHIAPLGGGTHYHLFQMFGFGQELGGSAVYLAVSLGLFLSIVAYFCVDLWEMAVGVVRAAKGKRDPGARLAAQLATATIPVAAIVLALPALDIKIPAPTPEIIGWSTVGAGALLFVLDRMSMTIKRLEHASFVDTMVVAVAQVIAILVPGVGRSTITMTFARAFGYERAEAARLSMLLGIPALGGWCVLQGIELVRANALVWQASLFLAGAVSFFAGLLTLAAMMAWLKRHTFAPFAIYRLLAGAAILVIVWQSG